MDIFFLPIHAQDNCGILHYIQWILLQIYFVMANFIKIKNDTIFWRFVVFPFLNHEKSLQNYFGLTMMMKQSSFPECHCHTNGSCGLSLKVLKMNRLQGRRLLLLNQGFKNMVPKKRPKYIFHDNPLGIWNSYLFSKFYSYRER